MACFRLMTVVAFALGTMAARTLPASCGQGYHPRPSSHLSQRQFYERNWPLLVPGGTIGPFFTVPQAPRFQPPEPFPAPAPSQSAPAPMPYYPHAAPSLSQGMTITVNKVLSEKPAPDDDRSKSPIATPVLAVRELAKCWAPPLPAKGETVEVTIRFGFDAKGSVLWPPRVTYVKAPEGVAREIVSASILDAVKACTPLDFTSSMAKSMPAYPLSVRYIGRRAEEGEAGR